MESLATLIYTRLLVSDGLPRRFWQFCRSLLVNLLHDPSCVMRVHGRELQMPLSHLLPHYQHANPFYDSLPGRLASFIASRGDGLICIDVGANIGDTVAAMFQGTGRYLAIEPIQKYSRYLRNNWSHMENVTIVEAVCSSSTATRAFQIVEKLGTASMVFGGDASSTSAQPLDNIITALTEFGQPNVIKIDTDGHDFEVISGAKTVIARCRPAVLFECDAFGNSTYVEDCLKTLNFFRTAGYRSFLVYDNYGYLMGKHELDHLSHFKDLLLYQLTSHFHYFDILVMKDEDIDMFLGNEQAVFASVVKDPRLSKTAKQLAGTKS